MGAAATSTHAVTDTMLTLHTATKQSAAASAVTTANLAQLFAADIDQLIWTLSVQQVQP
jgi:hypothetical protein